MTDETPAPLTAEDNAALDALRDAETRFWKAESTWADKGSGMTQDQKTGAHMAFVWLRTQRPVATRARSVPDDGLREVDRLANVLHDIGGEFCHPFTEYHPIAMHRGQAAAIRAALSASPAETP